MIESATCSELRWQLLYTKRDAERWAAANLRRQGFEVLLPLVAGRAQLRALFPRYVFAGYRDGQRPSAFRNTSGVAYVVYCGAVPAIVPTEVIAEVRERMDPHGYVHLDAVPEFDPLFVRRERERVRAMLKFAAAGFRVKAA